MARVNPKLLKKLQRELGLKQRQVYNRINEKAAAAMLPKDLAAVALAFDLRIDASRYASSEELDRIANRSVPVPLPDNGTLSKKGAATKPAKPARAKVYQDPFVDSGIVSAAEANARMYPVIYAFENSVRRFIERVMRGQYKSDWWDSEVHWKIGQNVLKRQKAEGHHPWHSRRGASPICYTDIDDLVKIITTHHALFKRTFGRRNVQTVVMWIEEIERTRNILAHNNPVSKRDRDRLRVYARDWSDLAKKCVEDGKCP